LFKFSHISLIAFSSLTLVISGCANSSHLPPAPKQDVAKLENIKKAPPLDPYRMQVGDTMDVKVRLNPELNESLIVPPDGIVSTTMAHDVQAYGRTVQEFRKDLVTQYAEELNNPNVSVIMRSFAPNRVYVAGEVTSPGEFVTAGPDLTLLQAISRAGGLKNSAGMDNIIIVRHKFGEMPKAYSVDYHAAITGEDPASDVRLAAYDVVYVPRSGVANVYSYFQQFVQQFLPTAFGLSYSLNPQTVVNR
jgi:polysaccharide export outer membrane protein